MRPRLDVCRRHACRYSDQLNQKSIRINKPNYFFAEARRHFLSGDVVLLETFQPITERVRRNRERGRFDLAGAAASAPRARPRKKCQDCSRRAAVVAEIEMITSRIVEIDRALDETQPEKSHVKIEVPLRIAGYRSNVMKSANFVFHHLTMSILSFSW